MRGSTVLPNGSFFSYVKSTYKNRTIAHSFHKQVLLIRRNVTILINKPNEVQTVIQSTRWLSICEMKMTPTSHLLHITTMKSCTDNIIHVANIDIRLEIIVK